MQSIPLTPVRVKRVAGRPRVRAKLTAVGKLALMPPMIRFSATLCLAITLAGCAAPEGPATHLEKANLLPLAIDDSYQFRQTLQNPVNNNLMLPSTTSEVVSFERSRDTWGAVDSAEIARRNGNYYIFFWRNSKRSDITFRFEYRQADLGNYVMAQERHYPDARGSHKSSFAVADDDFLENGRVTAWRALLIVDGRIVGLNQSFMWR